jgi:DNA (cytosine-5)-methyltransferase 1
MEMNIDLFCGGGGASTGIEASDGYAVDVAVNHNPDAIFYHKLNHPNTYHHPLDVFEVHPLKVTKGRKVGLLWLSPDCTHFSKAKGSAPKSKKIRSLATVGLWWARYAHPRTIFLENVAEFRSWGRLKKGTDQPDPRYKGEHFQMFVRRLRQHGYVVEWKVLKACDYGAPTFRERLILLARCDGRPIVWPKATHAKKVKIPMKHYHNASEYIDFSRPTVSIFATKEEVKAAGLRAKRPLAKKTMERIARGIWKFVLNNPKPFIIQIANYSASNGEYPVTSPLPTVTTGNRFALVDPFVIGIDNQSSNAEFPITDPLRTIDMQDRAYAFLLKYYGKSIGQKVDTPLDTISGNSKFALVNLLGNGLVLKDVGLRMFDPDELLGCQFGKHAKTYNISGLTKAKAVKMIGNSVCPEFAEAMVRANYKRRTIG